MPIYEYQCQACGHTLEALQKITEDALTDCPNCHKSALEKLISATSFQLKGTGWYVTDFRNKNQSNANKSDANQGADTAGDRSSTAETKPGGTTSSTDTTDK